MDNQFMACDMRTIYICKRCGVLIDIRRKEHHLEHHKRIDALSSLFGWAKELEMAENPDEIPF